MKIDGIGPRVPEPIPPAEGPAAHRSDQPFAQELARPDPTAPPANALPPIGSPDDLLTDLIADLQAGKIDARTALDTLVDRVVAAQVPPTAPAAVRDQVRSALQDTLKDDPYLSGKLSALEARR